jgi:hypothetical protein
MQTLGAGPCICDEIDRPELAAELRIANLSLFEHDFGETVVLQQKDLDGLFEPDRGPSSAMS